VVFIDDYAHHPEEIRVFVESVREIYPKKRLRLFFSRIFFRALKTWQKSLPNN
jgi:UDP-N-acetylmuramate--alanine ligase